MNNQLEQNKINAIAFYKAGGGKLLPSFFMKI